LPVLAGARQLGAVNRPGSRLAAPAVAPPPPLRRNRRVAWIRAGVRSGRLAGSAYLALKPLRWAGLASRARLLLRAASWPFAVVEILHLLAGPAARPAWPKPGSGQLAGAQWWPSLSGVRTLPGSSAWFRPARRVSRPLGDKGGHAVDAAAIDQLLGPCQLPQRVGTGGRPRRAVDARQRGSPDRAGSARRRAGPDGRRRDELGLARRSSAARLAGGGGRP